MTIPTEDRWFEVDRKGLAATIEQPERAPLELYQNAVDEPITQVTITLEPIAGRKAVALLRVEDDSPDGFSDLTESYRLYAPSKKRGDATKRGRMNVGEKRLLSLCNHATITSTTGTVTFNADGTRTRGRTKTEAGTVFEAEIRLKKVEVDAAVLLLRSVLPPEHVVVTVNGLVVPFRRPLHQFVATLPTVLPDEDGNLTRKSSRQTLVHVLEPQAGEKPTIFELGIPVVDGRDSYHVDVQQRVPLNTERDNITPGYLRQVRTLVLNEMHSRITEDDANKPWVQEAIKSPDVTPEAVATVIERRYGDKTVIFDPTDHEANRVAQSQGYTVVHGRSLPKETWNVVREHGLMQPAGQVTPSFSTIEMNVVGPDGQSDFMPKEKITESMANVAWYAEQVGHHVLGFKPDVQFVNKPTGGFLAAYGSRRLIFNVGQLGYAWFDMPVTELVDALLIHEFAHERCGDHLDHGFHKECCRLGAKLRTLRFGVNGQPIVTSGEV